MRILFLYTELADYTFACFRALKQIRPDVELMVIHYPVNPEAPFQFSFSNIGEFVCVNDYSNYASLKTDVKKFGPDKIISSGWVNKWYLRICFEFRKDAICILALDNHWFNTPKQRLLQAVSRFTLARIFGKVWVPGKPQREYAIRLGFNAERTVENFYSCDIGRFNTWYETNKEEKRKCFPTRLLCVARYIPAKGLHMLWDAFVEWKNRSSNNWELWCAGTGELFNSRVQHPAIKHLGFVQKEGWEDIIRETGIFVLPSIFEPWGVAVHEFAASGYPLLLSKYVGAGSLFLSRKNGFDFNPDNKEELIACFQRISELDTEKLSAMGEASHQMAQQITPTGWAHDLVSF